VTGGTVARILRGPLKEGEAVDKRERSAWRGVVGFLAELAFRELDLFGREARKRTEREAEREAARLEVTKLLSGADALERLDQRRLRGLVSDADFATGRERIVESLPPAPPLPTESAATVIGQIIILIAMLLGFYLVWVLATAWVVLTVLSTTVSTTVWLATIIAAVGLGALTTLAAGAIPLSDRLGGAAVALVPLVVEVIVFAVVRPT
jgi:hypothetical protein